MGMGVFNFQPIFWIFGNVFILWAVVVMRGAL